MLSRLDGRGIRTIFLSRWPFSLLFGGFGGGSTLFAVLEAVVVAVWRLEVLGWVLVAAVVPVVVVLVDLLG
jgi:hypothetical protein